MKSVNRTPDPTAAFVLVTSLMLPKEESKYKS
jgi:hypothetical protein